MSLSDFFYKKLNPKYFKELMSYHEIFNEP